MTARMSEDQRPPRTRLLVGACALSLLLAACGTDGPVDAISTLNPFKADEQLLPGERRSVLSEADPAAATTGKPAVIAAATPRADWPQPAGPADNDPGNVAAGQTGARAWSVRAGSSGGGAFGFGSSSGARLSARPVSSGGLVYVYDPAGNVSAHSLATGGAAWKVNVRPAGESDSVNGGGVALDGGRIFAATGFGEVVALDAASGARLWASRLDAPTRGAPTASAGKVFVVTQAGTVAAIDQGNGAEAWKVATSGRGAGLLASASPAVTGNLVIVPTTSGDILALDLATGAQKWAASVAGGSRTSAVSRLEDASASPVVHQGIVYATGVGGRIIAVKAETGEPVWQQQIGGAHTPVVSGNAVFLIDLAGRAVAFERSTGTVLWATALPTGSGKNRVTWAGPVLADGRLWAVSSSGDLVSLDAASGQASAPVPIGVEGSISPIAVGGRILVLGGNGTLVALN